MQFCFSKLSFQTRVVFSLQTRNCRVHCSYCLHCIRWEKEWVYLILKVITEVLSFLLPFYCNYWLSFQQNYLLNFYKYKLKYHTCQRKNSNVAPDLHVADSLKHFVVCFMLMHRWTRFSLSIRMTYRVKINFRYIYNAKKK